jgi:hypothetical protein
MASTIQAIEVEQGLSLDRLKTFPELSKINAES